MRVLVGCEFSGIVREAFRSKGHDAWSCDLLPTEIPGNHYQCDVLEVLDLGWDLAIFHPPCTHLAISGAAWFKGKEKEQRLALEFVNKLLNANIPKIALENPVSVISTRIRKPDQIIHPYYFGDPYSKKTCLWLKNLPLLVPDNIVNYDKNWSHNLSKKNRARNRSRTFKGIARAMSEQWYNTLCTYEDC